MLAALDTAFGAAAEERSAAAGEACLSLMASIAYAQPGLLAEVSASFN